MEALDEEEQHGGPGDGHADVDPDHREPHREGEAGDSEPGVVGPVPKEDEGDDGNEREAEGDEGLLDRRREVVREHVGDEVAVASDPEAGPEEHHPDEAVDRDLLGPRRRCEKHVPGEDLDEDRRHHDGEENRADDLEDEVDEVVEALQARPLGPRVCAHSRTRQPLLSRSTQGRPCRVKRTRAGCGPRWMPGPARRSRYAVKGALSQARQRAALVIARVKAGEPPVPEPLAAKQGAGPTVGELAQRFLEEYAAVRYKRATLTWTRTVVCRYIVQELGKLALAAVERTEVWELHHRLSHPPSIANTVVRTLSLEPRREFRRLFCVSHAAMAVCSVCR